MNTQSLISGGKLCMWIFVLSNDSFTQSVMVWYDMRDGKIMKHGNKEWT